MIFKSLSDQELPRNLWIPLKSACLEENVKELGPPSPHQDVQPHLESPSPWGHQAPFTPATQLCPFFTQALAFCIFLMSPALHPLLWPGAFSHLVNIYP